MLLLILTKYYINAFKIVFQHKTIFRRNDNCACMSHKLLGEANKKLSYRRETARQLCMST